MAERTAERTAEGTAERTAEGTAGPGPRFDDPAVAALLGRLDHQLSGVEEMAGPATDAALDAMGTLAEVYGEALARVVDHAGAYPDVLDALAGDELLAHLLALHHVHPEPARRRVARALDRIRPQVRGRGGDVELIAIDGSVARVRLSAGGCGSTARSMREAVEEAVLAAAPELSGVESAGAEAGPEAGGGAGARRPAAFVPTEALLRAPAGASTGARAGAPAGVSTGASSGAATRAAPGAPGALGGTA